ncbi:MAG: MFS transporter [Puniceicoccales bacterium]|jgi:phosphoglycerate transporter family protein|nr:MFS transporter [Puniceicoccales bacterium]
MTYVATQRGQDNKQREEKLLKTGVRSAMRRVYINRQYRYWRSRIFYSLFLGYAAFYLVRQNLTVAAPEMLKEFGYTKSQIGWIFALFSIIYGVGKFISGAICDRTDARYFMSIGLVGAAVCTLCAGFSRSIWVFALLYSLNGAFQSMGWPPVSRLMTHWYAPEELGTRWGLINGSHQFGSVILLLGGSLLLGYFGWRSVFIVPAVLALLLAGILFERLRDTPESLGLPPIEEKDDAACREVSKGEEVVTFREIFMEHLLPNRALWYVCMANFFVYIIRMGFFNWAPTFLQEARGASPLGSGAQSSIFELMGVLGGLFAGWASDRIFKGRRSHAGCYFMGVLIILLFLFWRLQTASQAVNTALLFLIGFFLYGPQTLLGMSGAELGGKRAAAAANGLTGTFGYLGGAVAGFGVGKIADNWGWNAVFLFFEICALLGSFFFILNRHQSSRGVQRASKF